MFRGRPRTAPVKHDLSKRRTLKHKSVLLKQYGVYALSAAYAMLATYWFVRWVSPPEYKTEEEQQMAQQKFGLSDMMIRF